MWSDVFSPKGPDPSGLRTLDSWDLRNYVGKKRPGLGNESSSEVQTVTPAVIDTASATDTDTIAVTTITNTTVTSAVAAIALALVATITTAITTAVRFISLNYSPSLPLSLSYTCCTVQYVL
jgi:vacuolar-type H+-ATPase catalytic subunit A/Vma1